MGIRFYLMGEEVKKTLWNWIERIPAPLARNPRAARIPELTLKSGGSGQEPSVTSNRRSVTRGMVTFQILAAAIDGLEPPFLFVSFLCGIYDLPPVNFCKRPRTVTFPTNGRTGASARLSLAASLPSQRGASRVKRRALQAALARVQACAKRAGCRLSL